MKQIITVLLIIISIVSLIILAFTIDQVSQEEERLTTELQYRSTLLAQSLRESVEPNFINKSDSYLQSVVERFSDNERLAGLGIYDNKNNIIAASSIIPEASFSAQAVVINAMDSDKATGEFENFGDQKVYVLAVPLHNEESIVGALMLIQNAGYIEDRITDIWKDNFIKLIIQVFLLGLAILLLIRWIIYEPIKGLANTVKLARIGNDDQGPKGITSSFFFNPLIKEIVKMRNSLTEARISASEEARLRLEKLESPWTVQRLQAFMNDTLKDRPITMVSNREPYIHTKNGGKIKYQFPASGMVTAIEPVMQACSGTWIAHGSGDADKLVVDKYNRVKVPPDEQKYTLRRIWLTKKEEQGYYNGFSNEGLWPLCHMAHTRPIFRKEDWGVYGKVNKKFADTILMEIKKQERPIVLIQDYHLALAAKMVKDQRPDAAIGIFWHIPWPNPEAFSICPWKKEILEGMLGADLIGFHTQLHCNNFIETVGREIESLIDLERFRIEKNNHVSYVKPFPISIAFSNDKELSSGKTEEEEREKLMKELGIKTKFIGLGVDRLDYTKGILERLKAIECFLNRYPSYKKKTTFIQIAAPSRTKVKKYREFATEVENEVKRINDIYKEKDWKPILLLKEHHEPKDVRRFFKAANFCLVTSLHDGMNLVAKEYVAAKSDEKGVLILSQYTGASKDLKDALIVNPYNAEQVADAIKNALDMTLKEQSKRMNAMRKTVRNYNVYRWSAEFLKMMDELG